MGNINQNSLSVIDYDHIQPNLTNHAYRLIQKTLTNLIITNTLKTSHKHKLTKSHYTHNKVSQAKTEYTQRPTALSHYSNNQQAFNSHTHTHMYLSAQKLLGIFQTPETFIKLLIEETHSLFMSPYGKIA